jgi:integrase
MLAFMRDEKKLSKRTSWTKLNIVVQWLKANGVIGLVKRGDWPRFVEVEPEAYSVEEIEKFLAECDQYERTVFEFFWMTGFRDAEVQHVTRAETWTCAARCKRSRWSGRLLAIGACTAN